MKLQIGQRLPFKRRLTKKTNYPARLALLKSGMPRVVVRRGNDNIRIQLVSYERAGDKTIVEELSRNIKKFGWNGHCGSLPAAYLVGMLFGKKAVKAGIESAVLDLGLQKSTHGSALYAAVKGMVDAGLNVPVGEEAFPSEERIRGDHIAKFAKAAKSADYKHQFKRHESENIVKNFNEVKSKIEKSE